MALYNKRNYYNLLKVGWEHIFFFIETLNTRNEGLNKLISHLENYLTIDYIKKFDWTLKKLARWLFSGSFLRPLIYEPKFSRAYNPSYQVIVPSFFLNTSIYCQHAANVWKLSTFFLDVDMVYLEKRKQGWIKKRRYMFYLCCCCKSKSLKLKMLN